jgi:hypothetical protein
MSYYNFIKTIILVFLIYQIPASIAQVSQFIVFFQYGFDYLGIYSIVFGLLSTVLVFFLLIMLIRHVDSVLKFLHIDRIFSPEDKIEWKFKNSNWISLIFIFLGLDLMFNYLPDTLIYGLTFFSQHTQEGLGNIMNTSDKIQGMTVFSNVSFVLLGGLLVYYSKWLGFFVKKRVFDQVEIIE